MDHMIRRPRDNVFLGHRFESISQWLQDAERPDSVWTVPVLDPAQAFALEDGRDRKQAGENHNNPCHRNQRRNQWLPFWREQSCKPSLKHHEYLVHFGHLRSSGEWKWLDLSSPAERF